MIQSSTSTCSSTPCIPPFRAHNRLAQYSRTYPGPSHSSTLVRTTKLRYTVSTQPSEAFIVGSVLVSQFDQSPLHRQRDTGRIPSPRARERRPRRVRKFVAVQCFHRIFIDVQSPSRISTNPPNPDRNRRARRSPFHLFILAVFETFNDRVRFIDGRPVPAASSCPVARSHAGSSLGHCATPERISTPPGGKIGNGIGGLTALFRYRDRAWRWVLHA